MKNIYNFKKSIFSILLLTCAAAHFNSQVSSYSFVQSNGTYSPITGGTSIATATAASGTASLYQITPIDVNLPFPFSFNDQVYNSCKVSSNGYITFGTTPPLTSTTSPISATVAYDGAISVFGKSINSFSNIAGKSGAIKTDVVGTAPNREFIIEWSNFKPAYSTSTTSVYSFSFQIRLKETSNAIDMVYDSGSFLIGSTSVSGTSQIGLRGRSNSDFNNRLNASTVAFTNSTSGTANSSTQYSSTTTTATAVLPPSGFTYTWTPPTCYTPTLTTTTSTSTSITVNWASSQTATGTFDIFYNTTGVAPTAATAPSIANVSGSSHTINNLSPSTLYYIWARTNCNSSSSSGWTPIYVTESTKCLPPTLTLTGQTICPGASATLTANTTAGATVKWYDSQTATTPIATGATFTTPALNTTTNYYATSSQGGDMFTSKQTLESNASTGGGVSSYLKFTAYSDFVLKTVDLFPYAATNGTPGTAVIQLRDNTGAVLQSKTVNVVGYNTVAGSTPQTVTLDFNITPGVDYQLGIGSWTGITNMYRDSSNLAFPYSLPGILDITGGSLSTPYLYFFYNWKIGADCTTIPQMVTAVVDPTACLGTSEVNSKDAVTIYPNPFTEIININSKSITKKATILDMNGRVIKTIENPSSILKLQDLQQGLYLLHLEMKDGSIQSSKIIKK